MSKVKQERVLKLYGTNPVLMNSMALVSILRKEST